MMRIVLFATAALGFFQNVVAVETSPHVTALAELSPRGNSNVCAPRLCTGLATMDGHTTHLTYVCPEPTGVAKPTVFVTVTQTRTVTPVVTTVVTVPAPALPTSVALTSDDSTTVVIIHSTQTIRVTRTIQRHSSSPAHVASSSSTESSVAYMPLPETPVVSDIEPSKELTKTLEPVSTSLAETFVITSTSDLVTFPTLVPSHGNGTTDGIFYTRSANSTLCHGTGHPTASSITTQDTEVEKTRTVAYTNTESNTTSETSGHVMGSPTTTAIRYTSDGEAITKKGSAVGTTSTALDSSSNANPPAITTTAGPTTSRSYQEVVNSILASWSLRASMSRASSTSPSETTTYRSFKEVADSIIASLYHTTSTNTEATPFTGAISTSRRFFLSDSTVSYMSPSWFSVASPTASVRLGELDLNATEHMAMRGRDDGGTPIVSDAAGNTDGADPHLGKGGVRGGGGRPAPAVPHKGEGNDVKIVGGTIVIGLMAALLLWVG
ncbi:hypothetical protein BS50DRAFT_672888 [Corynespora cassiicola Philippines]|uniref:Uncharacterized protein n=1 Tax=Corynespora cassiicola Philippines TaxID=1448308 RepID=A0A2T2P3B8_CORCC|nr:hypothetical protein BS50DRAFT_672888 [Corynespora cassiicola Philippines]